MSTKYIASNWRLPNEENSNKSDNYGLSFSGNEFINCGSSSSLLTTGGLSVSWWMKTTVTANDALVLMDDYGAGNRNWQIAHLSSGNVIRFYVYGSPNAFVLANTSINDGNWHHVVCTYEPSTALRIYIDGSLDNSNTTSIPATRNNSAANLTIGKDYFNNYYTGDISEVSVFDYALSSTQISTLYGSSSLGAGNPMALPTPVAYYPLGDNSASNPLTQPNEAVEDASVFDFDGSNDYIQTGGLTINNTFTFSCWLNVDSFSLANQCFLSSPNYYSAGFDGNFIIRLNNNTTINFYSYDGTGSGESITCTVPTISTGSWHHFALTNDGSTAQYYWDGSPITTTGVNTKGLDNLSAGLIIGDNITNNNNAFNGKISNVVLWDSDQSSEISNIYNSGVPATSYTNTPTAWYKLDQSANWEADSSGNWQIPDAVSAYPQSFDFDGSDDFIDCGNNSSLQIFQNSHTQSFWIKYTGTVQGYIGGYGVDSVVIFHGTDRIRFYTKGLTSGTDFYSTSTLSDNEWYHIACTYELNGDKKIYINGVLDNTVSTSGTITSEGVAYTIGARNLNSSIDNYFEGNISNVQLFNTALPATGTDSIETLYNNGVPLTTAIASDNLKAWYKLDNTATFSTNWSIPDASGNGNTGTSSGMTEQNLVNNNVSVLNGESSGMTSANLVLSDLTRAVPYDSYSFNFDAASTDYIQTTSNSLFNGLTAFSISCWIKTNGTQLDYAAVFSYQSSTSQYVKLAFYPSEKDRIRVVVRPGSTNPNYVKSSAGSIVDGEWVHIVAVGDANNLSNLNLYINGVLDNDVTQGNITTLAQSTDIYIGTDAGAATTREFNGKISNISVFNEALTSTEVLKLYSNGVPQNLANFNPQPQAWYPLGSNSFWNGSQWTVRDMIGSNDGTGQNIGVDGLVGDAPRSEANGTGTNMDIPTNLEGSTKWSSNNSWSINMSSTARVEDTP